jgi:mycothiol synthase
MSELMTRPYADADAAPLAAMFNAIDRADGGSAQITEADIRRWLTSSQRHDLDSRVMVADGSLVAAAVVLPAAPGARKLLVDGGVLPAWRGRGIGRELLAWQFRRAAELAAEADPGATWTLASGAFESAERTISLLRRFGMEPVRYFLEMAAPTAGAGDAAAPDGFRITDLTDKALWPAVHQAHTEAFADHWDYYARDLDDWLARTVAWSEHRPDLSRVALDGDAVAAYVLCYDSTDGEVEVGHVGTRRAWRRRGLASMLLSRVLRAGADAGTAVMTLHVDADSPTGAVGVYERLGFTSRRAPMVAYHATLQPDSTDGG